MGRTLIIAEKPSVAADIAKVVGAGTKGEHAWEGDDHVVSWAVGHLLEFVPPEGYDDNLKRWRLKDLPILPEQFKLTPTRGSTKQLNALKKYIKAKDVDRVVNACDAGREGELIFQEIYRFAGVDKPVDRLWLQSMTGKAIAEGLANVRKNEDVSGLADAADCRAESDWLIGMNATRALTVRLRSSRDKNVWSAGRVQTATLAMLVRREHEILAHQPEDYWVINATFATPGQDWEAVWFDDDKDGPRDRIFDKARADAIVALLSKNPAGSASETRKETKETAPPLFDLTSLQREANRRFGFSARRTLSSAQALYEGHKLITYPRTDSRALPEDYREKVGEALQFLAALPDYKEHAERLLADGLSNESRNFDDKAVSDHFAIIPTGDGSTKNLRADEKKIFDLVTRRFLAGFHPQARHEEVERITQVENERFRTRRKVLKYAGWRAVWDKGEGGQKALLPPLKDADGTDCKTLEHTIEEKQTKPPSRLTEAAILGLMETAGKEVDDEHLAQVLKETGGLGTPATRAEIIETLINREYAARCTGVDNKKALRATPRGIRLIDALERINLPRLTSAELTADLEDSLRAIERGDAERTAYMGDIRGWTTEIVEAIRGFEFDTLYEGIAPIAKCPVCGKDVTENLRTWSCADAGPGGTCSFVVWKEVGGRYVDRFSAIQLATEGKTPVKGGFFTRDHREYEAMLVRQEDGKVRAVSATQADSALVDVEEIDISPCPFHAEEGLMIRRTSAGYQCQGKGEKKCGYGKKHCTLNLPLTLCQRELTVEEVKLLLGEEHKTALLEGFVSRYNKPFSASLLLQENGKIKWDFPPRQGRGGAAEALKEFPVVEGELAPCPRKGRCPGDGKIIETATHFKCSADDCTIAVPREICSRELTRVEATALFGAGETELLSDFVSRKSGKAFNASLYLKKNGKHGFRFNK